MFSTHQYFYIQPEEQRILEQYQLQQIAQLEILQTIKQTKFQRQDAQNFNISLPQPKINIKPCFVLQKKRQLLINFDSHSYQFKYSKAIDGNSKETKSFLKYFMTQIKNFLQKKKKTRRLSEYQTLKFEQFLNLKVNFEAFQQLFDVENRVFGVDKHYVNLCREGKRFIKENVSLISKRKRFHQINIQRENEECLQENLYKIFRNNEIICNMSITFHKIKKGRSNIYIVIQIHKLLSQFI